VQRPLDADASVPAGIELPPGFQAGIYAAGGRLTGATAITWDPDGTLWLAQQQGEVWKLEDRDGDGRADTASLFASGFPILVGLLWHPDDGTLYASNRGSITAVRDEDGDGRADSYRVLVDDLPFSRHHNNGLAWGPDGKLYFGLGSGADVGQEGDPWFATILRMPSGGGREDIEVVARGLRNAYDLAFNRAGQLLAGENGPDAVAGPDELNHIVEGQHYGYPRVFGYDDGGGQFRVPVWTFPDHSSADGLTVYEAGQFPAEYRGNVFIALFGNLFGDSVAGHQVDRVILTPSGDTFTGRGEPFMTGLDRPLDVTVGPDGSLYVLEYLTGTVYRVTWQGASSG